MIHIYRAHISCQLVGSCRFYPSCSEYAQQAFTELPLSSAFAKTFSRLCRCHPLGSKKLYDPLRKEA